MTRVWSGSDVDGAGVTQASAGMMWVEAGMTLVGVRSPLSPSLPSP